jgi:hypothetical protein
MLKGSCLCGGVRIAVASAPEHPPEACHCGMCRKQSGHYLAAVNVLKTDLTVEGDDSVAWFRSSEKVRRGFCSVCGSTLFWAPVMDGYRHIAVAMGLFDKSTSMRIAKHTFVGDKGDYYELPDDGAVRSEGY